MKSEKFNLAGHLFIIFILVLSLTYLTSYLNKEASGQHSDVNLSIPINLTFNHEKLVKTNSNPTNIIPNQYIVIFKDEVKNPTFSIDKIVSKIKANTLKDLQIRGVFNNVLKGS
ncbi:MAG: hypothetical protein R3321_03720, partial [Nitrososphaeraceae archaeon]|nr:hypothetical protein [Nitrososphaeraceae archaeon]